jgi:hypothetical protein
MRQHALRTCPLQADRKTKVCLGHCWAVLPQAGNADNDEQHHDNGLGNQSLIVPPSQRIASRRSLTRSQSMTAIVLANSTMIAPYETKYSNG